MVNVNGRLFAQTKKEIKDSPDTKFVGFAKVLKNGIRLSNMNNQAFVFLVNNKYNERFAVTCRKEEGGKYRYMYSTTDADAKIIGFDTLSLFETQSAITDAYASIGIEAHKVHW